MTGFVYAIQSGALVKLGWSADPLKRVSKIASDSPHGAKLLGAIAGSKEDEACLHSDFSELHVRGEWFEFDTSLADHIAAWPKVILDRTSKKRATSLVCGSAINAFRNRYNLSLEQFGNLVGVKKAAVSKWEKNRIPAERVLNVERLTGISRSELRPDIYPHESDAA